MSIIGNLLDNAVDATLTAPVPAPVELYISDRNQELLIEVADRGCGVDDALKPHIFRQGFSSKPDSENDIVGYRARYRPVSGGRLYQQSGRQH